MADVAVFSPDAEWAAKKLATMEPRVKRAFTKAMKAASAPVGQKILQAYGMEMPQAGGLAERIQTLGKVSILADLKSASIYLVLRNGAGMYMQAFEKGLVRHPVFGEWLGGQEPQKVPAGVGAKTLEGEADALAQKAADAVTQTVWKELTK